MNQIKRMLYKRPRLNKTKLLLKQFKKKIGTGELWKMMERCQQTDNDGMRDGCCIVYIVLRVSVWECVRAYKRITTLTIQNNIKVKEVSLSCSRLRAFFSVRVGQNPWMAWLLVKGKGKGIGEDWRHSQSKENPTTPEFQIELWRLNFFGRKKDI